jgi:hypothetical protein
MKRSLRPRTTAELSKSLNHQLNMYALAAGAAGVGLLALATPAEAKIIYTPAHVIIKKPFLLDLNHDGIVEFDLLRFGSHDAPLAWLKACQVTRTFSGYPTCSGSTNSVRSTSSKGRFFAAALSKGARIGRDDRFRYGFRAPLGTVCCFTLSSTEWYGPWFNGGKGVRNRYLGVKFNIKGRFHFGWARLTVSTTTLGNYTAVLTGYAYETIPGKGIIAGKTKGPDVITVDPTSLGHLAAGASAIPGGRRAKQAVNAY